MSVNFNEEKKLWKQGYTMIVGLDEAGRGPLAGPVVAAAVMTKPGIKYSFQKINDSKKLSEKQRDFFYQQLTNHKDIKWGVGIVSEKVIDKINILEASKLAMQKAIDNLGAKADFLILDGNFKIHSKLPQKPVIGGDGKVFSCAAAGIIAKVTRDSLMAKYHKKYPQYGFDKHKGYGTKTHIKALRTLGPLKIHRKSFFPVKGIG